MKSLAFSVVAFFSPVVALAAAASTDFTPFEEFVSSLGVIINMLIPIAVALAVLLFFWGLATYIFASGDPGQRESGREKMIWGVIALFIIVSIWGIVGWIGSILGIGQGGTAPVPGVATTAGEDGEPPESIL